MAPPVDSENQANKVRVDTSEICNKFKTPDRIIAAAWQHSIGINRRSKMSHGRSKLVDAGTSDVRRTEPRLSELRLSVPSNEARRTSLFYMLFHRKRQNEKKERNIYDKNKGIISNYFG